MALEDYFAVYGGREFALPKIAGSYIGHALVICGDGANVWDDLEAYGCRSNRGRGKVEKTGHHFMVVNKLGETFPGHIEHWYSNEAKLLADFVKARRNEYSKEFHGPAHTHSNHKGAKGHWPLGGHGTSGLGACLVGVGLGYEQITLCGLPLDDGPHNGEPPWRHCRFESAEAASQVTGAPNAHWKRARDLAFAGKVKSMSGRTREWLGAPDSVCHPT